MKLTINIKKLGRTKNHISNEIISVDLKQKETIFIDLLKSIVDQQVKEYNKRDKEKSILNYISNGKIESKPEYGKIGFGFLYNKKKGDVKVAQENVIQAYKDGLFSFFIDDKEVQNLSEKILLSDKSIITIIRLTFLTGSYF